MEESKSKVKRTGRTTKKKYNKIPCAVLHILARVNNTILSLTDQSGNVFAGESAGTCGFTNCRKSTPHANNTIIKTMMQRAHEQFGVKELDLVIKGPGPARDMLMFFQHPAIAITSICDKTNVPYGGVRQRRARRN